MADRQPENAGKPSLSRAAFATVSCYGFASWRASTRAKLYCRYTVRMDDQRLLKRLEIWRSLRTDSLAVAMRRLPSVVARIGIAIEHARAMAGSPVDATLIRPLNGDPPGRLVEIAPLPMSVQPYSPLTLGEAYRNYVDDPTRAWTANTREAYETSRNLATGVIGKGDPHRVDFTRALP